tara:strand:+ start:105 stop:410 length:306 start_codon:yes stop_codon:yes gene_type:complete
MKKLFLMMGLAAISAIGFVGCSSTPTIDCSNEESYNSSIQSMIESLKGDEEKQQQLGAAFVMLSMRAAFDNSSKSPEEIRCELFGGKTADEIVNTAKDQVK